MILRSSSTSRVLCPNPSLQQHPLTPERVAGMARPLSIMHLVFDYNGTLAEDGDARRLALLLQLRSVCA